jgi:ketosteroid isomerase-like protein
MRKVLAAMALIATSSVAQAGPNEDAYQGVEQWSNAFRDSDVDALTKLYAPDALMIGTAGKVVLTTPDQIYKYFDLNLNANNPRTAKLNSSEALVINDKYGHPNWLPHSHWSEGRTADHWYGSSDLRSRQARGRLDDRAPAPFVIAANVNSTIDVCQISPQVIPKLTRFANNN